MGIKNLLALLSLISLVSSEHILSTKNDNEPVILCDNGNGECIPYHQCTNKTSNKNDEDHLDIRFNDENTCIDYFEICCPLNKVTSRIESEKLPVESACGVRNDNGIGVRITGNFDNEAEYGDLISMYTTFSWRPIVEVSSYSPLERLENIVNLENDFKVGFVLEFPWMVILFEKIGNDNKLSYLCGGSLISEKVVLTAAHCVQNKRPENIWIRVGDWDTQTNNEIYLPSDHPVEKVIKHEGYNNRTMYNDLALLFLKDGPKLSTLINTICLPPQNKKFIGKRCIVSGWGKNVDGLQGRYQAIMKKVELPIVESSQCQTSLRGALKRPTFTLNESFLCAGGEGGLDTCKGDGGSPLVCEIDGMSGQYYQAGIVSWGVGCGTKGVPGVYVDVSKFRNWIDKQIKIN